MESISDEKKNFIIIQLVVTGISPRAVRKIFDREFHPKCLKGSLRTKSMKIKDLKDKGVLSKAQMNLLYPDVGEFFFMESTVIISSNMCITTNLFLARSSFKFIMGLTTCRPLRYMYKTLNFKQGIYIVITEQYFLFLLLFYTLSPGSNNLYFLTYHVVFGLNLYKRRRDIVIIFRWPWHLIKIIDLFDVFLSRTELANFLIFDTRRQHIREMFWLLILDELYLSYTIFRLWHAPSLI